MRSSTSSSDIISDNNTEAPPAEKHSEDAFQMPWALLIALMIGVVIECFAYANLEKTFVEKQLFPPRQVPGITHTIVEAKVEYILHDQTKVDLLVMGDSSGLMGVDAEILEKETGLKTYNLCTIGYLGVEGNLFLLEQHIKTHGVPSVVVFHTAPDTWGYAEEHFRGWGWQSLIKERFLNPDEKIKIRFKKLPSKNFRLLAQRGILPNSFTKSLMRKKRGKYRSHDDLLKFLSDHQGSMNEIKFDYDIWKNTPKLKRNISAVQLNAFQELVNLSEQKRFRLCVICNPLPEIAQTPHNEMIVREIERKVVEVVESKKGNNVRVRQPFVQYLSNPSFSTTNHLSPQAKPEYTQKLARWIQNRRR